MKKLVHCRAVFGENGANKMWLILEGENLYVDPSDTDSPRKTRVFKSQANGDNREAAAFILDEIPGSSSGNSQARLAIVMRPLGTADIISAMGGGGLLTYEADPDWWSQTSPSARKELSSSKLASRIKKLLTDAGHTVDDVQCLTSEEELPLVQIAVANVDSQQVDLIKWKLTTQPFGR